MGGEVEDLAVAAAHLTEEVVVVVSPTEEEAAADVAVSLIEELVVVDFLMVENKVAGATDRSASGE